MKRWVDPTTGRSRDEGRGGQRSGQGQSFRFVPIRSDSLDSDSSERCTLSTLTGAHRTHTLTASVLVMPHSLHAPQLLSASATDQVDECNWPPKLAPPPHTLLAASSSGTGRRRAAGCCPGCARVSCPAEG